MVTKTLQNASTLKYGYMWVEETTFKTLPSGDRVKTVVKKMTRDPTVGFFRKLLRV